MKNFLRAFIILTICCSVILLSGCDSQTEPDLDFAPVPEIRENFSRTVEKLKAREFDNLNFSNADFSFPEIDSISELSLDRFNGKSAQEIYDFFGASLDALVPGKFSDEQKLNEIRFYDGKNPDGTFQTIKEYTLTDYPWPFVETDECFMDMLHGVLRWFDNGDFKRWRGEEGCPSMETMVGHGKLVDSITDMNCTDKYNLTNGEISVKDAADFVNNYLATIDFSPYELSARCKAAAVNVVDIGKGKYGYNFIITPEYNNVLFDYGVTGGGIATRMVENDYDKRRYEIFPGQINMIETDKVYCFIDPAYYMSIDKTENHTSIITPENAAEIVSEFYSSSMKFAVTSVQAVYLPYGLKVEPCWKFIMSYFGEEYHTFVNMRTGEVHVYIFG